MSFFRRWKRRGQRVLDAVTRNDREAKIYVEKITFSSGEEIVLSDSSILVIVGPNNAGKSSVLREIRDNVQDRYRLGPVLRDVEIRVKGSAEAFKKQIVDSGLATGKQDVIKIGTSEYELERVDSEIKDGFVGSKVIPFFLSYLGAEERLRISDPTRRGEYFRSAPKNPMQWLELDEVAEERISEIFERTFNAKIVLNTLAGDELVLHILRNEDEGAIHSTTREEANWLASLPRLQRQGDGMRSFAGTVMSLLVHPTSTILLDEPEAFLHPPQARKLAEVIAADVPGGCQVIVATHNDLFVRALLDASGNRVILARIVRDKNVNRIKVLDSTRIKEMWNDPLIRTSDILSALFHDAAILCEGDSDSRFYKALLDATKEEGIVTDTQFFHLGGKDRIPSIAKALKAIEIPVIAIVDIDILSDRDNFARLFEAMGGRIDEIDQDVRSVIRSVSERRGKLNGAEMAVELRRLAASVETAKDVDKVVRTTLLNLGRDTSNWQRVKHDGFRALDAQTFRRISEACKQVGLLINPEGELEGFCRDISRARKSEWLAEAVRRNIAEDATMSDARAFAGEIRRVVQRVATGRSDKTP